MPFAPALPTDPTPVVGVANTNDLDFDTLYSLQSYDPVLVDHLREEHGDGSDCDCEWEATTEYHADAPFVETPKGLDAPGASLLLKVNWDCFTVQVLQSPVVETHGRCSPCYPGQADLDAVGSLLCFALPPDLRAQE